MGEKAGILYAKNPSGDMIPVAVDVTGKLLIVSSDKGHFLNEAAILATYPNTIADPSVRSGWYCTNEDTDTFWLWDFNTNVWVDSTSGATGDVSGPGSSTDNAIVRFNGLSGKIIQNGLVTIDDNGTINIPAGQDFTIGGKKLYKNVSLVSSNSITPDGDATKIKVLFELTYTHSGAMNAVTNQVKGCEYVFLITIDGVGNRVMTWNANYHFGENTDPVLNVGAGEVHMLSGISNGTNIIMGNMIYNAG